MTTRLDFSFYIIMDNNHLSFLSPSDISSRQGSFLESPSMLGSSFRSICSSIASLNVSIAEDNSSVDSDDLELINKKTKEIANYLTSRLTAFAFFSNKLSNAEREQLQAANAIATNSSKTSTSLCQPLSTEQGQNSKINIQELIEKIAFLERRIEDSRNILEYRQNEIQTLEDEEKTLNQKLVEIEDYIKDRAEFGKNHEAKCECDIF